MIGDNQMKLFSAITIFIEEKIKGTNWNDVDIICHSMGGIITRAALQIRRTYQKGRFILPHHILVVLLILFYNQSRNSY